MLNNYHFCIAMRIEGALLENDEQLTQSGCTGMYREAGPTVNSKLI